MFLRVLLSHLFFFCILLSNAQFGKWQLYIGPHTDSLYNSSTTKYINNGFISFPIFSPFDNSTVILNEESSKEKMSRAGIILNAKTITGRTFNIELFLLNGIDSSRVYANIESDETYHGRSALSSVFNLFSKEEDKSPQDEPYSTTALKKMSGLIEFGGQTAYFKNDSLLLGAETLIIKRAAQLVHSKKKKKIKKANKHYPAFMLMKNDTCIAAFDRYIYPYTFYCRKNLPVFQQHVVSAFFVVKHISVGLKED